MSGKYNGKGLGLLLVTVFLMVTVCGVALATSNLPVTEVPATEYPKNDSGQTYGSALHASSPKDEPDLIKAVGTNGREGYVLSSDLNGSQPNNPEEAAEYMERMMRMETAAIQNAINSKAVAEDGSVTYVTRTIPLYEKDGKTVIGTFEISNTVYCSMEKLPHN